MPPRLLTAAALLAAVAIAVMVPLALRLAMIGLVLLLCWREWLRMAGINRPLARSSAIVLFAGLLALPVAWPLPSSFSYAAMVLGVAWWCLALPVLRGPTRPLGNTAAAACGLLALAPAWLAVLALAAAEQTGLLLLLLLLVAAADTGAFTFGKLFGRRALAPKLSKGKTMEGAAGGVAMATLAGFGASFLVENSALYWTLAGMAIGFFSMLGDLTVSLFKRRAGIKDSGRSLPGHGGMLDRLDSGLATAPLLVLLVFEPLGWLPL
ncbi:MAG: phosphatidate cytidylyltransferase [Gammaproteobacteria bacterium]|nr:phosphatidate cytidylyltransferase [Gammaproteobacteria bacterium]